MYEVLDTDLGFKYQDLKIFIPAVGGILTFVTFWFTWQSEKFQSKMLSKFGEDIGRANIIIYTKILGGLLMGVLPAAAYFIAFPKTTFSDLGFSLSSYTMFATLVWTVGLGCLMGVLVWNNARKPISLQHYPQIRSRNWTRKMMAGNLLGWTVYLTGYEFLFRGVLLFPLVEEMGLWPAIAVNIVLYSGTHIPKGLKETLGAIPLAIVLCLICVQTGNIWVAVLVHLIMAYTNTLTSFGRNPEMKFINT